MSQLKKVFMKLCLVKNGQNSAKIQEVLKRHKREILKNSLKKGYKDMAFVNLSLAEMCFDADNEALRQYEEKLTECE